MCGETYLPRGNNFHSGFDNAGTWPSKASDEGIHHLRGPIRCYDTDHGEGGLWWQGILVEGK